MGSSADIKPISSIHVYHYTSTSSGVRGESEQKRRLHGEEMNRYRFRICHVAHNSQKRQLLTLTTWAQWFLSPTAEMSEG